MGGLPTCVHVDNCLDEGKYRKALKAAPSPPVILADITIAVSDWNRLINGPVVRPANTSPKNNPVFSMKQARPSMFSEV